MTMSVLTGIPVEKLVDSFFCKECESVDISNQNIRCRLKDCECNQRLPLEDIFDLYSSLFSILDSANFRAYLSLTQYENEIRGEKSQFKISGKIMSLMASTVT